MSPDLVALVEELRSRERRDATGLYVVEGVRFLVSAADAGAHVVGLITCRAVLTSAVGRMLVRRMRRRGVPVAELNAEAYRKVARLRDGTGRGVLAVVRQRWSHVDGIGSRDLWLAVEGARSAGNVGTLLRTCLAVGVRGVFAVGDVDLHDPSCVRATMGALHGLQLARVDPEALVGIARRSHARIVGTSPAASADFRRVSYRGAAIVVVGSERRGMSDDLLRACDVLVRIPMSGRVDSLNLAVAGSLVLYEASRR